MENKYFQCQNPEKFRPEAEKELKFPPLFFKVTQQGGEFKLFLDQNPQNITFLPQNFRAFGAILLQFYCFVGFICMFFTPETISLALVFIFHACGAGFFPQTVLFTTTVCKKYFVHV